MFLVGNVLRIVRERYLRSDFTCQIVNCRGCPAGPTPLASSALHVLIPDVDMLVDYLELFETLNINGIVIAQTVLDVVENEMHSTNRRSLLRRLRTLAQDGRRFSAIFPNENFIDTYYECIPPVTLKQRRDFAIAKLAGWYAAHLKKHAPAQCSVIMLTNKEYVKPYAEEMGVTVMSMKEYVAGFRETDADYQLFETITQVVAEMKAMKDMPKRHFGGDEAVDPYMNFVEYLADDVLEAGVKSGTFGHGKLQVNTNLSSEATVDLKDTNGAITVIVPGHCLRNRAIHGDDVVVVPIQAERVWGLFPRYRRSNGPFGRVVGVERTNWRKYVCTLQAEAELPSSGTTGWLMAVPWDYRIPKIKIKTRQYEQIVNSRILVQIDTWSAESMFPQGHYVTNLGDIGLRETEMSVLLHEADVDASTHAPVVVAELPPHNPPSYPWKPNLNDPELGPRRDLTDWRIYSIDPPGCQDIDDALSFRRLPRGSVQVGVHIADVAAFVKEGSQLDLEAQARGTSVYLTDRRIDMLPTLLSERLCSLRCDEERYAVSVIWEIDSRGNVVDTWYGRTLIKTCYEMAYSDAQDILDGKPSARAKFSADYDSLRDELLGLRRIFHMLKDARFRRGALELETVEVSFQLDQEKKPMKLKTKESLEVHGLVAEFMIFANCAVAEFLAKHLPESALLRKHPLPPATDANFKEVLELAQSRGCHIDFSSNLALAQSLERAASMGDRMFTLMLRTLTTLAMAEAEYMSSGSCSVEEFYHYGLAADFYTHFTSPIRRYADLVVHRQLIAVLDQQRRVKEATQGGIIGGSNSSSNTSYAPWWQSHPASNPVDVSIHTPSNARIQEIAEHLNYKNRQAKTVQRNSRELYQNMYFASRENKDSTEIAVVVALKPTGLMLFFPKYAYHCKLALKDTSNYALTSSGGNPTVFDANAFPSMRQSGGIPMLGSGQVATASSVSGGSAVATAMHGKETADGSGSIASFLPPSSAPSSSSSSQSTLESFQTSNSGEMIINTTLGIHIVHLFDRISLKIGVTANRYHMGRVHLNAVRFETKTYAELDKWHNPTSIPLSASRGGGDGSAIVDPTPNPSITSPPTSVPPLTGVTPKHMIQDILKAERSAQAKMKEEMMRLVPSELRALAHSAPTSLYKWCQYDADMLPYLTKVDVARVVAAYVLSKRGLQPNFYSSSSPLSFPHPLSFDALLASSSSPSSSSSQAPTSLKLRRIRQPVCIFKRKSTVTGRRCFQESDYKKALIDNAASSTTSAYEIYDDGTGEGPVARPSSLKPSIPGVTFGPSASFGTTKITSQQQNRSLGFAAAQAEREFRAAQAQVSKSKYASRHY